MRLSEEEINRARAMVDELKKDDQVESFGGVVIVARGMDKTKNIEKVNEAMRNIAEIGAQRMQDLERQLEDIEVKESEPINRQTSFGKLFKQQHNRKNYLKGQRR